MQDPVSQLPSLRQTLSKLDLRAKKSLGQNFLLDTYITDKIAQAATPFEGSVIEIGPGPGGLTRSILLQGAPHLIAIEKDKRAVRYLEALQQAAGTRLAVMEADALTLPIWELGQQPRQIIANLPYNIATPLLIQWLEHASAFTKMTLMFQKEVAQRIVAKPGDSNFGRLSVLSNWLTFSEILFEVPASAFTPPPKVTSAVIQLIPRQKPEFDCSLKHLEKVTQIAFNQRRKMLRASFKQFGGADMLASLGIDPQSRPQELPTEYFCKLANHLATQIELKNIVGPI